MQRLPGLLIGAAITAVMCTLVATGVSDHLEHRALDFHFRRFNHIDASERIVHVDITTEAIERSSRWPWPRDRLAGIIDTLHQAGASIIAQDLILPEPEADKYEVPSRDPYAVLTGGIETMGIAGQGTWIEADKLYAAAMRRAGNVYIGVDFEGPDAGLTPTAEERQRDGVKRRVAPMLHEDFGLDAATISSELGIEVTYINNYIISDLKRRVAIARVDELITEDPTITFDAVHRRILGRPPTYINADLTDLKRAYAHVLGVREVLAKCGPVPAGLVGKIRQVHHLTPPWHLLAESVQGVGFVVFARHQIGGVVRFQELMVDFRGRLVKQLGFAIACEALGIRDEQLHMDDNGDLRIDADANLARPAFHVQLNDDRQMLVNWHTAPSWDKSFDPHLPVEKILEVLNLRMVIEDNRKQIEILRAEIADRFLGGEEKLTYAALVTKQVSLRKDLHDLRRDGADSEPLESAQRALHEVVAARDRMDRELEANVKLWHDDVQSVTAADEDERRYIDQVREAYRWIESSIPQRKKINAVNDEDLHALLTDLMKRLKGTICVLGYTATAVADFMVSPVFVQAPGVMTHTNLVNTFLQNRFIRRTQPLGSMLIVAVAGLGAVLVTLSFGPVRSLLFVLSAMVIYFFGHAVVLFGRYGVWATSVMPLLTIFVAWAFVTLYRQLTEERSKRHVAKALGQYTSPAIAQNIVEASTDLSPREGVVTCYFSDLKGFTTISERLGAERTKAILNPYFEAMSEVLIRRGAMINKYIGDAVFAFFNAPLFACPDHERACCHAALESVEALRTLKSGERYGDLREDLQRLEMRLGVNTGPVFVGDYGSENKLDYTCIGDTVNLAARLEPANKVFGTVIMISENTYSAVTGEFEVRHLGGLQVKGKQQSVQVYELLSRSGELDDEQRRFAELFGRAVVAFQSRDFYAAAATFGTCLELRPGDPGAARYLAVIALYKTAPPPDDWNGALELTEK